MSRKVIGIAGHAGIGHVNGVAGFIQDDSAGFITVSSMIADLLHADTRIREAQANVDANTITITTMDGGTCTTSPRRGITPAEARLIEGIVGQDALFCQSVAVNCLGRMFGQPISIKPQLVGLLCEFDRGGHLRPAIEQAEANGRRWRKLRQHADLLVSDSNSTDFLERWLTRFVTDVEERAASI